MNKSLSFKYPYWLALINYWVSSKSKTGLTIPFIIGAYNIFLSKGNEDQENIKRLLYSIINSNIDNSISIFYCDTIGDYVLSTNKVPGIEIKNDSNNRTNFTISFSAQAIGKNIEELVVNFEKMYNKILIENKYSKINLKWDYFNEDDLTLIREALKEKI